ncbi:thiol:disulfide interchange protein DsbA/DsbL [Shewanella colwelliana]|uniref:Thiol:disulfide interchange protein n=1 Tax=Shewanella colwelliana TaxID=23 RepID=A0A1E5IXA9_SHECO|nr:thiol:disulfide interchange protein DsbA/DsbL [Shewanella colwelliana]MCZ4338263.1 thiol:disulfide interchange protein DsbA/DsbL [Shewanella colwelliana]MDX1280667.1 thiol:disulfide interchange protein DsbA/DsbL [Shewanella colwelliana]OEG74788.1 disulfide bond formation protein DsbA [Shewanella colwelliana]GIU20715.1 thiol:disulfide interchange protein [Shewanella colwelliana]GIU42574.1 thiol:disulfide interchange protein [Shewanella colwelliana]
MKKALLVAFALLMAPMAAMAVDFKEGVNYTVVSEGPGTAKPEIAEFFSFYCPHCYNFAKAQVPQIKANLPEGVVFKQNHVEFIGREMGTEMSRAFAVAHQLKVEDKIEHALFSAIHDKKQRFVSRDDIRQVFIANGVEGKDFDAAANSFMVSAQMAQMKRATENAKLSGVPAIVVNGKYRVEMGSLKSFDELTQLTDYLTKLK